MEREKRKYVYVGSVLGNQTNTVGQQINEARARFWELRDVFRVNFIEPAIQRRLARLSTILGSLQTQVKEPQKEAETVKCPYCGAEIPKDAKYCLNCGALLREKQKPTRLSVEL